MNSETVFSSPLPTLQEIAERTPAAQHAHATAWTINVLRTAMNDGVLVPGLKLSEQHIAEQLNISRNTLRQAFMMLVSQNLVEQIPNRGVYVRTPDIEQVNEMFAVRLALESAALELAPAGQHSHMREIIGRSRLSHLKQSVSGMAAANQDFHRELVRLAASKRLDSLMSSVLAEMRLLFFSMETVPSFHAQYIERNQELLHHIEAGEKQKAQKALKEYLKASHQSFTEKLSQQGIH